MSDRRFSRPEYDPEDWIPPTQIRHEKRPPPTPEDREREIEIGLRFERVALSHRLGLEIQAKCGLCRPDKAQRDALKTLRGMAKGRGAARVRKDLPAEALAGLDSAFEALLAKLACSHCEARHECRAKRRLSY